MTFKNWWGKLTTLSLVVFTGAVFGFACDPGMEINPNPVDLACDYKYVNHSPSDESELSYLFQSSGIPQHRTVGFSEPSPELLKKYGSDGRNEKAIECEFQCECGYEAKPKFDGQACGDDGKLANMFEEYCQSGKVRVPVKFFGLIQSSATLESAQRGKVCEMVVRAEKKPTVWNRCEALCRAASSKKESVKAQCCVRTTESGRPTSKRKSNGH